MHLPLRGILLHFGLPSLKTALNECGVHDKSRYMLCQRCYSIIFVSSLQSVIDNFDECLSLGSSQLLIRLRGS